MIGSNQLVGLVANAHDGWGHWWLFAPLVWAFWLAAIATLIWLARRGPWWRGRDPHERASAILAERFASGELSADQYRERLDQLRESGTAAGGSKRRTG